MVAYVDNPRTLNGLVDALGAVDSLLGEVNDQPDLERIQALKQVRVNLLAPHHSGFVKPT